MYNNTEFEIIKRLANRLRGEVFSLNYNQLFRADFLHKYHTLFEYIYILLKSLEGSGEVYYRDKNGYEMANSYDRYIGDIRNIYTRVCEDPITVIIQNITKVLLNSIKTGDILGQPLQFSINQIINRFLTQEGRIIKGLSETLYSLFIEMLIGMVARDKAIIKNKVAVGELLIHLTSIFLKFEGANPTIIGNNRFRRVMANFGG